MLVLAGRAKTHGEAVKMLRQALESGAGLRKLKEMIRAQGGDPAVCDDVSLLPQAPVRRTVACGRTGYVRAMDTVALGTAAQAMGAGRLRKEDAIDYAAGFVLKVRLGDRTEPDILLPVPRIFGRRSRRTARYVSRERYPSAPVRRPQWPRQPSGQP